MPRFDLKQLEIEMKTEEKIARILGAMPLMKLSDYPMLLGDHFDILETPSILEHGYIATINLKDYETIVPNGKNIIDRKGYAYIDGPFSESMFTLSEWRESSSDKQKPHLLINANWYNIWESGIPDNGNKINPRTFVRTFLSGLVISNGEVVSEHTALDQNDIPLDSIIIDKKRHIATIFSNNEITTLKQANKFPLKNIDAVSGFILLKNGMIVSTPHQNNNALNHAARTGIGISENGKKLYIIVVQPGIKHIGVTAHEFAAIFKKLGVNEAINLDNNGSTELLYVGTSDFGQPIKIQTRTSDIRVDGTRDFERPKANFIGFYPTNNRNPKAKDDSYLFFSKKKHHRVNKTYSKDDLEVLKSERICAIKHDSYFNNKRKTRYESRLAHLCLQNASLFIQSTFKVSNLIVLDIKKIITDKSTLTSAAMRSYFFNDYDLTVLFGQYKHNPQKFYEEIIDTLQSGDSNHFYKQMCIHRAYITFFMEKGEAKPSLNIAKDEGWLSHYVDFDRMLYDMSRWRKGLFEGNKRNSRGFTNKEGTIRPSIFGLTTKNIGVITTEEYPLLSSGEQYALMDQLPIHKSGMQEFYMTTRGSFTSSGMHDFDMPQVCGPSGMTAMRLALANQASLSQSEKELHAFAVCMYHVAIGAHTVDESFCIANKGEFNHYQRGNYESILPVAIREHGEFTHLFAAIMQLTTEYSDLFPDKQRVVPHLPCQASTSYS